MKDNELETLKRGHLIDILKTKKAGVLEKIATYNCKKNTLILYNATSNVLLRSQFYVLAGLEQMQAEYNGNEELLK